MNLQGMLDTLREDLENGKFDEFHKQYFADLDAKENARVLFFENEFTAKFALLKQHLVDTQESISDNDFHYHSLDFITCDEYWEIFECIRQYTDTKLVDDSSAVFSTSGFIYDNVVFELISGQGTILRTYIAPENQTTYPATPEFMICRNDTGITGVYRFGELIAKDLDTPADLLQLLGYSAGIMHVECSDSLPDLLKDI